MNASATSRAEKRAVGDAVADRGDAEIGERASFDHLRHGEEAVLGGRRVGEDLVADAAVGDDVVAQAQLLGMTAVIGSTPATSTSPQLLDPAEDVGELGRERLDLRIADGDAGELGDMADGGGIDGHGRRG